MHASAAAPGALDQLAKPQGLAVISAVDPYRLETEMTVKNWVLCISENEAETLVKARQEGPGKGDEAYAALRAHKACGQFPELRVILQQPVYEPAPDAPYQARIFGALVKFSDQWARGYVVSGDE